MNAVTIQKPEETTLRRTAGENVCVDEVYTQWGRPGNSATGRSYAVLREGRLVRVYGITLVPPSRYRLVLAGDDDVLTVASDCSLYPVAAINSRVGSDLTIWNDR